jgi:LPXTG-site transpeptidase (sortase) family protein
MTKKRDLKHGNGRADTLLTWLVGILGAILVLFPLASNLANSAYEYNAAQQYERAVAQATGEAQAAEAAYIAAYNEQVRALAAGETPTSLTVEDFSDLDGLDDLDEDDWRDLDDSYDPDDFDGADAASADQSDGADGSTQATGDNASPNKRRVPQLAVPKIEQVNLVGELIGVLEIPTINQTLTIRAGTRAADLNTTVGLVNGTSIPRGGINEHSVIAGHRGLVGADVFRYLDQVQVGDVFYISASGERFAYEVTSIEVLDPDKAADFRIVEGKSLVTLMTCTPYMVNSHRLLVHGELIDTQPEVNTGRPSWWIPLVLLVLTSGSLLLVVLLLRRGSVQLWNVSADDADTAVVGSTFALYRYQPGKFKPAKLTFEELTSEHTGKNTLVAESLTADESGLVISKKLPRGHYYLVQLEAPADYLPNHAPVLARVAFRRLKWGRRGHFTFTNTPR